MERAAAAGGAGPACCRPGGRWRPGREVAARPSSTRAVELSPVSRARTSNMGKAGLAVWKTTSHQSELGCVSLELAQFWEAPRAAASSEMAEGRPASPDEASYQHFESIPPHLSMLSAMPGSDGVRRPTRVLQVGDDVFATSASDMNADLAFPPLPSSVLPTQRLAGLWSVSRPVTFGCTNNSDALRGPDAVVPRPGRGPLTPWLSSRARSSSGWGRWERVGSGAGGWCVPVLPLTRTRREQVPERVLTPGAWHAQTGRIRKRRSLSMEQLAEALWRTLQLGAPEMDILRQDTVRRIDCHPKCRGVAIRARLRKRLARSASPIV